MTLITDQTRDLNPWNLRDGDRCFQILIDLNTTYHDGRHVEYSAKISVPDSLARDLEEAATMAFSLAQQDGMDAPMMMYCAFYFYDEDGWSQFL